MKVLNKIIIFSYIIFTALTICVFAESAIDITSESQIICDGINADRILDDSVYTHSNGNNVKITVDSKEPIGGIYIKYFGIPRQGMLDHSTPIAENGFIHEYIKVDGKFNATLFFPYTDICDLYVYSVGSLPENVQLWEIGNTETDILLCATHSDDDQLFFAGLLPYYAKHYGANVRVAYFINHFDGAYNRPHELLDGLWECGIKNYPDISPFPDGYSESKDDALALLQKHGHSYQSICDFQKGLLDKYKPLVAVLHDFNGEYGHGAHMLNTESFINVCQTTTGYVPEKIYVHLYKDNQITLPIDQELECFGGKTAFQVSQKAFGYHKSQHWTWFYNWIYGKNNNITKASQIRSYNPAKYGLYYSSVGPDTGENCMLENITIYKDRTVILPDIPESDSDDTSKTFSKLSEKAESKKEKSNYSILLQSVLVMALLSIILINKKR